MKNKTADHNSTVYESRYFDDRDKARPDQILEYIRQEWTPKAIADMTHTNQVKVKKVAKDHGYYLQFNGVADVYMKDDIVPVRLNNRANNRKY